MEEVRIKRGLTYDIHTELTMDSDVGSLVATANPWYDKDMEVDMELTKKTTILLPPDLHEQLAELARQRKVSLGHLIRSACRRQYGIASREERLEAVRELCRLGLPVGTVARMKRESVSDPAGLAP